MLRPKKKSTPPIVQVRPYLIPTYKTSEILTKFHEKISTGDQSPKASSLLTFTLDEEKKSKFLSYLKIGLSVPEAIIGSKIPIKEMKSYISENRDGIQLEIAEAMIDKKAIHLSRIAKAGQGWQASAFYLERKYRDEFGKETTVKIDESKKQIMKLGGREIEF